MGQPLSPTQKETRMQTQDLWQRIQARIDYLRGWLRNTRSQVFTEQKHVDEGHDRAILLALRNTWWVPLMSSGRLTSSDTDSALNESCDYQGRNSQRCELQGPESGARNSAEQTRSGRERLGAPE